MSCGWCGYICVKRAGCRIDADGGCSCVIGCNGAPHPTPGWGQAPALHFSFDPGLSLFGRRWLVSPAGAGIDPGSESGTCFRTNCTCRLVPAHQGMKIGCIGWWECSSVIATTHTSPLDSRFRGNDEVGGGDDGPRRGDRDPRT